MKVTYIGQAGLIFEKDGFKICVDPYLSDSCLALNPRNRRRHPVDPAFLKPDYDMLVLTHDHMDHTDPQTYPNLLKTERSVTVLAPYSAWNRVREQKGNHNYVMFNPGTQWTENGIRFTAVKAVHSDLYAIGVLIDDGEKVYYVTGDTLYDESIFAQLPEKIDVLFMPVNGVGCNMNFADAERFAARVNPSKTVPFHIGMFDDKTADGLKAPGKVIPEIYREIRL